MTTASGPPQQCHPDRRDNPLDGLVDVLRSSRRGGLVRRGGVISEVRAGGCRVAGLADRARLGDLVEYDSSGHTALAQVAAIDSDTVTIEPFESVAGLSRGHTAWLRGPLELAVDGSWRGRIVDALARPIDDRGNLRRGPRARPLDRNPPDPLTRQPVERPLQTGVKAIDAFVPLCAGQRIGIFAGSGVGKSTLLGMIVRARQFDVVVVALVGERGREVGEFIREILAEALSRAIVVVATGDDSPMMRRLAPETAMAIAEHFRDGGEQVLLIVDSITRYAHALREVALAGGEPPVARGYAPSVFATLPRLLERAGPGAAGEGAITAVFAVLVDGDDHDEPIADVVRGILDGHIVLDRGLANRGQYPAIDIARSISRLTHKALSSAQIQTAKVLRSMIAEYEDTRELRLLGAYRSGNNPELDRAVALAPQIYRYLAQGPGDPPAADTFRDMSAILAALP